MQPAKTVELKTLFINKIPVQVVKNVVLEYHATQEYRENECKKTSMGEHCRGCPVCEISL